MRDKEKTKGHAVQDALEYAESIIDTVREPLIVLDGDLRVVTASRSFYQVFKVKVEETERQFIYDLGNRQWDIPKLRQLLEEIVPNNAAFDNFEVEHDFPGIGKRIMLLNARRIPRPPARPRIILLAIEDITERKKGMTEAHRRSAVLGAINQVLQETLTSESYEAVARKCLAVSEELTGSQFGFIDEMNRAGRFDIIAISDPGWEACRIPHSRELLMQNDLEIRGILGRVIKDERSIIFNNPTSHPDWAGIPEGHPRLTCFLGVPLKYGSKTIGMIGLGNKESGYDLADQEAIEALSTVFVEALKRKRAREELRVSETNYRTIFNAANDAIFLHDMETGKILDVNQKMCEMYGYSPEEASDLTIEDVSSSKPSYTQQDALRWIKKAAEGEPQLFEWMARDKSGRLFWVEVNLKRAVIGDKERLLAVVRDITQRKQMEEQIAKVQRLESLGILAGGIAHDFNNMLTGILANISIAKLYGDLKEDISRILTDAQAAGVRAKGLTQQLLTFARGGEPIRKTIHISRLLTETAKFALSGSGTRCEFSLPDDLWLVDADEGQISQVIQNVVINADEAMAEGGIIKIRAENLILGENEYVNLKGGRYVRISIEDQGCGIPERQLSNIFDPFFTIKEKGRGLGLTTSFSIVNRHGGHIHVGSEVGVGTTLDIYLPASEKPSIGKEAEKGTLIQGEGRILLIDDEDIIRRSGKEVLKRLGYEVELAEDGAEGIELYKKARDSGRPFRAVIMDLTIPGGMGGKHAIEKLMNMDPQAKVIVSSGYSDDPVMSNFREYGFSGVVRKPYSIEELGEMLYKAIAEVD